MASNPVSMSRWIRREKPSIFRYGTLSATLARSVEGGRDTTMGGLQLDGMTLDVQYAQNFRLDGFPSESFNVENYPECLSIDSGYGCILRLYLF